MNNKWVNYGQLILGLWILLAPWLLGFSFVTPALWSSIISGTLTAFLGLWSILNENE